MPMYEYRCDLCGYEFEKLQRMSDDPLRDCPSCGASSLVKLVSAVGFQLKGTGWYVTDFKNNKQNEKKADLNNQKPPQTGVDANSEKVTNKKEEKNSNSAKPNPSGKGETTSVKGDTLKKNEK